MLDENMKSQNKWDFIELSKSCYQWIMIKMWRKQVSCGYK